MNLSTQEKISKLMLEQADKIGKALRALRLILSLPDQATIKEAKKIASDTIREVADYGKDPEDL